MPRIRVGLSANHGVNILHYGWGLLWVRTFPSAWAAPLLQGTSWLSKGLEAFWLSMAFEGLRP